MAYCNEAVKEINLPIIQQYIRDVNSVLDIGCGTGCFVEAAKSLGMQSEGLELDKSNSLFAASRGLKVHNVCIEECVTKKKYDLIHMTNAFYLLHRSTFSNAEGQKYAIRRRSFCYAR